MEWSGPVSEALGQTAALNAGQIELADAFWSPARLVRAAIDSGLDGQQGVEAISLANEVAVHAYAGIPANEQLNQLKHNLTSNDMLDVTIRQTQDYASSDATAPESSRATSERILKKLPAEPLLMVAICHGGLAACLQTALYTARHRDVVVYPVRSSIRKHGDRGCYMQDTEVRHLQSIAANRTVVAHDEDASGGTTVQRAVQSLNRLLYPTRALGVVNSDGRDYKDRYEKQGEWWEKV